MTKFVRDFLVSAVERPHPRYCLLTLHSTEALPPVRPGQFVSVRIDGTKHTFLRRPISVHDVDAAAGNLHLLVQVVGEGTAWMASLRPGDAVNLLFPLGNGFTTALPSGARVLLAGGGVGAAPLLYLGKELRRLGFKPEFLLGARSSQDFVRPEVYAAVGPLFCTTEDGSMGERGFVTQHSCLMRNSYDFIYTCGPKPMMMAVARYARQAGTGCEVSLENTMACGIGACLCCVEDTRQGHQCVCTAGPVFNIDELKW